MLNICYNKSFWGYFWEVKNIFDILYKTVSREIRRKDKEVVFNIFHLYKTYARVPIEILK